MALKNYKDPTLFGFVILAISALVTQKHQIEIIFGTRCSLHLVKVKGGVFMSRSTVRVILGQVLCIAT